MHEFTRLTSEPMTEQIPRQKNPVENKSPQIASERTDEIATYLINAEVLLQHKEFDLAKSLIYKSLAINSNHPQALRLAAQILNPNRDLEKIAKIYCQIATVENTFENRVQYANCLYKLGKDRSAFENYSEALFFSPIISNQNSEIFFEIYKNMGTILTRESDFHGAEEYFHKAFALNPTSDQLLVNLGTLEIQLCDHKQAIQRFRSAIEVNSKNDKAWVGLALIHNSLGDTLLALGNIETALELNPRNRTAVHLYANWSVKEQRIHQAIERLQDFVSISDFDEEMSLLLIHLMCMVNQGYAAQLECERVFSWNPKSQKIAEIYEEVSQVYGTMRG